MAATKVFAVPELFEVIFLNLPERDILLLQRTSRDVSDNIRGSPALQRRLYLQPLKDRQEEDEWTTSNSHFSPNVLNPMLFHQGRGMFQSLDNSRILVRLPTHTVCVFSQWKKEDSFLDMYLTNPPVKELLMSVGSRQDCLVVSVTNDAGIKARDLLDKAPEAWKSQPSRALVVIEEY